MNKTTDRRKGLPGAYNSRGLGCWGALAVLGGRSLEQELRPYIENHKQQGEMEHWKQHAASETSKSNPNKTLSPARLHLLSLPKTGTATRD